MIMTDYPMKRIPFTLIPGHTCCPDDPTCPWNGGWLVFWEPRKHNRKVLHPMFFGDKLRPARRIKA